MSVLDTELKFFEKNKAEWLKLYAGKFVLVKGEELVGFYDTTETAISEGIKRFGTESFLVRRVLPQDEKIQIPALMLGLLNAIAA